MTSLALLAVAVLAVGCLIGCVGIGGVLLPPALVYLGGLDLHGALAVSVWSFFFTGVVGTWAYARRGSIDWRSALWLGVAVTPAAVLGALVSSALPEDALKLALAVLVAAAGIDALANRPRGQREAGALGRAWLASTGAFVGAGSAVTGTGGPVLLVPTLLLARVSLLSAMGLGQVVQIPVSVFATAGFAVHGEVHPLLGTVVGLGAAAGALAGARLAHRAPASAIRRVVATTCIGTGILMVLPAL